MTAAQRRLSAVAVLAGGRGGPSHTTGGDADGRLLMDDPAVFPAEIRPFAAAHTAGLERLKTRTSMVDWLMLTPPALLEIDGRRTGSYQIGDETAPPAPAHLSYADLAVAMIDEIETPHQASSPHHTFRIS